LPIVGFINKFILNKEFNLEKCGQPPLISEGGHPFLVREAASPQRVEAGHPFYFFKKKKLFMIYL